jgi:hypothetical protein
MEEYTMQLAIDPFLGSSPIMITSCYPPCADFWTRHFIVILSLCLGFAAGIIFYNSIKELKTAVDGFLGINSKKGVEDLKIILLGMAGALILSLIVKLIELIIRIIIEWKRFDKQRQHSINQPNNTNELINETELSLYKFKRNIKTASLNNHYLPKHYNSSC